MQTEETPAVEETERSAASESFKLWLEQSAEGGAAPNAEAQVCELRALQQRLCLAAEPQPTTTTIFLGATCTDPTVTATLAAITQHAPVLQTLAQGNDDDAYIQQRRVIAAFGWLCGTKRHSCDLAASFWRVCERLYDEDVVGEDAFLEWWSAERSDTTLNTAPFIKWLREAAEEEEEEEVTPAAAAPAPVAAAPVVTAPRVWTDDNPPHKLSSIPAGGFIRVVDARASTMPSRGRFAKASHFCFSGGSGKDATGAYRTLHWVGETKMSRDYEKSKHSHKER
jgi:hypothetical protein